MVEKHGTRIVETAFEARGPSAVRPFATCWYGAWALLWWQWPLSGLCFSRLRLDRVVGRFRDVVPIRLVP